MRADCLCRTEGIIPALEPAHALAYVAKLAPTLSKDTVVVVGLSGRGDKDLQTVQAVPEVDLCITDGRSMVA